MEELLSAEQPSLTLTEIAQAFGDQKTKTYEIMLRPRLKALDTMGTSRRFGALPFFDMDNRVSLADETQFFALSTQLPDGCVVICFRGTDLTLAGWKESLNLGSEKPVPAQLQARDYVERAAHQAKQLILLGHSKGGNLALFAAVHAKKAVQDKIRQVFVFDSPGLPAATIQTEAFLRVQQRLSVYLPQRALVGLLFESGVTPHVVACGALGLLQHDPFRWAVRGEDFDEKPRLGLTGRVTRLAIKDAFAQLPPPDRQRFVDTLYRLVTVGGAETLGQWLRQGRRNSAAMIRELGDLPPESVKLMRRVFSALYAGHWYALRRLIGIRLHAWRMRLNRRLVALRGENG